MIWLLKQNNTKESINYFLDTINTVVTTIFILWKNDTSSMIIRKTHFMLKCIKWAMVLEKNYRSSI